MPTESPSAGAVSKEGYEAAFQHQQLKEELAKCKFPVYALGGEVLLAHCSGSLLDKIFSRMTCSVLHCGAGVTTDNIGLLAGMGFKGAAVLGSVWCAPDPVCEAERMQHAADVAMVYA